MRSRAQTNLARADAIIRAGSGPSARSRVSPFLAMEVSSAAAARERDGARIVHLEIGEPAAAAPAAARAAAVDAIGKGRIGYTSALGRAELRARIARHYAERYGADIAPERVVVTTGSSGGFTLAFLALFDPGARVAISSPGYPAYTNILCALGLEAVHLETGPETGYIVTAEMIATAHRKQALDGVLLMSPANPSGTMMGRDELEAICVTCRRLGISFLSDEVYHGLTYTEPAETALAIADDAVVVNSFSKYYCMTGWRVGWLVLPEWLVRPVERLQQSLQISVPYLSQIAAEVAFDASVELESVKLGYARSRAMLLEALPRLGFGEFHPVDGAFYVYVDVQRFSDDSVSFCRRMLEEAGVAATPGIDFDRRRGSRTMRLSFSGGEAVVAEAIDRIERWLE